MASVPQNPIPVRARHEAAHAVVAWALGREVSYIHIREEQTGEGGAVTFTSTLEVQQLVENGCGTLESHAKAREDIAIHLAGFVETEPMDPHVDHHCKDDFDQAKALAEVLVKSGRRGWLGRKRKIEAIRNKAIIVAREKLLEHAETVDEVADILERTQTADFRTLDLCRSRSPDERRLYLIGQALIKRADSETDELS